MQLGIGALCFMICVIYLVVYYSTTSQLKGSVGPSASTKSKPSKPPSQQAQYPPPPPPPPPAPPQAYHPSGPFWRPPAYVPQAPPAYIPQAAPGQIPWNPNRRY